nr:hypothetical protein [Kibdelosporangium sp. MJ126-NF4]
MVHDPSTLTPLYGEAEFAKQMEGLVADEAPRLFAVVQEYGERVDGRIAAWGMAFDGCADVIATEDGSRVNVRDPESALHLFAVGTRIRAHLVWVNPEAATRDEGD